MVAIPLHEFKFVVKFEKERGQRRQRVEKFVVKAETGMGAWIDFLNHFVHETNTGRIQEVRCSVNPYVSSE